MSKPANTAFGPAAVEPLIAALTDPREDVLVRAYAARGLGELGDQRAFLPLMSALATRDSHVRGAVVEAFGTLGDRRAVEPLILVLTARQEDPVVRTSAAYSLSQLGDGRAVAPLLDTLNDADATVRDNVAYSLGQLGDPRALSALAWAQQHDSDPKARGTAAQAVAHIRRRHEAVGTE